MLQTKTSKAKFIQNILPFITISHLQKTPKKQFLNVDNFKIVLSNNEEIGVIMSVDFFKKILPHPLDSQIQEEVWEMQDKETIKSIKAAEKAKKNKTLHKLKSYSDIQKKFNLN